MELVSINRGRRSRQPGARSATGIDKRPVHGPVFIGVDGVESDAVCDGRYHGGADQAVYIYGGADYAWWEAHDNRPFPPGSFGENLVVSGLETGPLAVGDFLTVGDVRLQVTDARIPCGTLERHIGEKGFAKRFTAALRPGAYCRVLVPGTVETGAPVRYEPWTGDRLTLAEIVIDQAKPNLAPESLSRFLDLPISERLRAKKLRQQAEGK